MRRLHPHHRAYPLWSARAVQSTSRGSRTHCGSVGATARNRAERNWVMCHCKPPSPGGGRLHCACGVRRSAAPGQVALYHRRPMRGSEVNSKDRLESPLGDDLDGPVDFALDTVHRGEWHPRLLGERLLRELPLDSNGSQPRRVDLHFRVDPIRHGSPLASYCTASARELPQGQSHTTASSPSVERPRPEADVKRMIGRLTRVRTLSDPPANRRRPPGATAWNRVEQNCSDMSLQDQTPSPQDPMVDPVAALRAQRGTVKLTARRGSRPAKSRRHAGCGLPVRARDRSRCARAP